MKLSPAIIFTVLFWLALFLMGYPMPTTDDVTYLGPALNVAEGGTFSVPHSPEIQSFGPPDRFSYMPLEGYMLAFWLKVFGIGRTAIASFQCLACAIASLAFVRLIRTGVRWPLYYAVALNFAIAIFLSNRGFRPDGVGLALFALGLQLFLAESSLAWFFSSLALFLSIFASPLFGTLALVSLYWLFFGEKASEAGSRVFWTRLSLTAIAGALAFLVFLFLIQFDLITFLVMFNRNRQIAGSFSLSAKLMDPREVFKLFFQILIPLLCLAGLFTFAKLGRPCFSRPLCNRDIIALVLASFGIVLDMFSSASGEYLLDFFFVTTCLLFASRIQERYQKAAVILSAFFLAMFFFNFGRAFAQTLQIGFTTLPDQSDQIRAELDALKPAQIYIDSAAEDAYYHYRLPANAYDVFFGVGNTWTGSAHGPSDYPPGSVLVISKQLALHSGFADLAKKQAHLVHQPMLVIGGLYPEMEANPYELVVVNLNNP